MSYNTRKTMTKQQRYCDKNKEKFPQKCRRYYEENKKKVARNGSWSIQGVIWRTKSKETEYTRNRYHKITEENKQKLRDIRENEFEACLKKNYNSD